jgi:hypothetical protein
MSPTRVFPFAPVRPGAASAVEGTNAGIASSDVVAAVFRKSRREAGGSERLIFYSLYWLFELLGSSPTGLEFASSSSMKTFIISVSS